MVWYGMVFIYSTPVYILHSHSTQDAEREMHEVQYLYVAFPRSISSGTQKSLNYL